MKKLKILTTAVALGTAAALALGGTFAWQSINQTALNEASDIVNPGGRLHDDFDGTNKHIYVENFADEPIFARVQLSEYFKVVMNYNTPAQTELELIGSTEKDDQSGEVTGYNYEVFKFADRVDKDTKTVKAANVTEGEGTQNYWTWSYGSDDAYYYMPTFNLNKDSLVADINGIYEEGNVGTISNRNDANDPQYTEYTDWTTAESKTKTGTEIYDGDVNSLDEVGSDFENLANYSNNIVTKENMVHTAKTVGTTKGLISMADWLALNDGAYSADTHGNYWVYDDDGWVYWSSPIAADTATGSLIDTVALSGVMDDTWYYAINVTAQFVTANDVGKADNTGFYDTTNGSVPSADAEALLKEIGVEYPTDANNGTGGANSDLPETGKALEEYSWAEISAIAAAGKGDDYFDVGDAKAITLNGTVGTKTYSDYEAKAIIIGFDHNSALEGKNKIHFLISGSGRDGLVGLVDDQYNKKTTTNGAFHMNSADTNVGGWASSEMRTTVLGADSDPNNPKANTLLAALPSELRNVMTVTTKYTDNVGKDTSTEDSITTTSDYLFLLSEYEVQGSHKMAHQYEQNKQQQYDYFANGNSTVAYDATDTDAVCWWRLRSPGRYSSSYFCYVETDGKSNSNTGVESGAVLAGFTV